MRKSLTRAVSVTVIAAFVLQGCVTTTHQKITQLGRADRAPRVLLMPAEVTLGHVTAGGIFEPSAEWTALGETHIRTALAAFMKEQNVSLVTYGDAAEPAARAQHRQLIKLHRAVGQSILLHQFPTPLQLPTKSKGFDWSLGPDVTALGRNFDAEYGLFVFMKDSYATAGRVAAIILAAALFGAALPGGQQTGFASLVDLRTGEIVWFNFLGRGEGDLRKAEPAAKSVELLMAKFPK